MATLLELRGQLDAIDKQIVNLYEQRMALSEQVGYIKLETGKPILDEKRENEKLAEVSEFCASECNKEGVRELFEHLMAMSRKRQYEVFERIPFEKEDK